MRGNRFAFFVTLGIVIIAGALTSHAAACVSAGHGVGQNCDPPVGFDTSQHCFVGKDRLTPHIGSAYVLDTKAKIEPYNWPDLLMPCTGRAVSAWVMFYGDTAAQDGTQNLIQTGYWMDCNWQGQRLYFQTWHNGNDTACSPQPYCRWHHNTLWAWAGGAHTFNIHRTAGTNTFVSSIDGGSQFAPVTVSNAYAHQAALMEDTVPNQPNAACNLGEFLFTLYGVAPPGSGNRFSWVDDQPLIYPGMHFWNEIPLGYDDYFVASDWTYQ